MSDFRGLFAIRAYRESDKNLILSTFLKGLYYGYGEENPPSIWGHDVDKRIFMDNYKKVAAAFLDSPKVTIAVACLPDDPDTILGYSILGTSGSVLHWVFVKSVWRNKSIAKTLVPASITTVTHLSKLGKELLPKLNNPIFNPFAL